jgi:hypothetical protein
MRRTKAKVAAPPVVLAPNGYSYPLDHWKELKRFSEGNEYDPKGLFRLADDTWDAWPYADNGRPTEAKRHQFGFSSLHSFLKLYAKLYCYQRLLGNAGHLTENQAKLSKVLAFADKYVIEQEFESLDDIADPDVFNELWTALLIDKRNEGGQLRRNAISRQEKTRPFWLFLNRRFNRPMMVPPVSPHAGERKVDMVAEDKYVIPDVVSVQLVNRLGLHREGTAILNRYHHLRLCVLVLAMCLGRRIDEILNSPRGAGPDGSLTRYPYRNGVPEGALWFQFSPNKGGPDNLVYVSQEWEDIVYYCVQSLIYYSDEVREFASPAEQGLLILVSNWNWTAGPYGANWKVAGGEDFDRNTRRDAYFNRRQHAGMLRATGLSYNALYYWMNGYHRENKGKGRDATVDRWKVVPGALHAWNITVDGTAEGTIYKLRFHQMRHTRQTVLAGDRRISVLARQRDMNHKSRDMQLAYQHNLRVENERLLAKINQSLMVGKGANLLSDLFGPKGCKCASGHKGLCAEKPVRWSRPGHKQGQPKLFDNRWRKLIGNSPLFLQANRVACGYCTLPRGPEGCSEYMNCTESAEGGCDWFVTDPNDPQTLAEISRRAADHRRRQQESSAAGRTVQAEKYGALAGRTERLLEEVLSHSSQEASRKFKEIVSGKSGETCHPA